MYCVSVSRIADIPVFERKAQKTGYCLQALRAHTITTTFRLPVFAECQDSQGTPTPGRQPLWTRRCIMCERLTRVT